MADSAQLPRELHSLKMELIREFRHGRWSELGRSLGLLIRMSESEGQKELCLRAQSIRELLGSRATGRDSAGPRLEQLFNDLLFHLSHFEWLTQARADPAHSSALPNSGMESALDVV